MPAPPTARALAAAVALPWRAHRTAFIIQILITVVAGLTPVVAAALLRAVLDALVGAGHPDRLALVALLAAASGVQNVLPAASQYMAAQSGRAVEQLASTELFRSVGRLAGLRLLEDPAFLDRLYRAQRVSTSGPGQVFNSVSAAAQSALTVIGFLAVLLAASPVLAAVVLAAAVPGVVAEAGIARRRAAMLEGISPAERRRYFYSSLITSLEAAKEIRLFGLAGFFRRRMLDELQVIQRAGERVDRHEALVVSMLAMLSATVAGGGIWWAVSSAARGTLTVGDVSMLIAALGSAGGALTLIISNMAMAYQAVLTFRAYTDVVAERGDLAVPAHPAPARALCHAIEFDDVWFRYGPDLPWILRGASLVIERGQAVALVGRNGAGKSTLVKLLCRFYDPDRGRIMWDGVDLRDLDLDQLRDRISAVFQDYMAYELSARENIAVGDLRVGQRPEAVAAAAKLAGVHGMLTELPEGYATPLTRIYTDLADKEDARTGVLLSGGQWQRVALARALLRDGRDLLILDEPSSGLDAEAEHEIHRRLQLHRQGRTSVLISHRLNAIRDADRIVVLSNGSVVEQGDHDHLMALAGRYARMFSLQANGFIDRTRPERAMSAAAEGDSGD